MVFKINPKYYNKKKVMLIQIQVNNKLSEVHYQQIKQKHLIFSKKADISQFENDFSTEELTAVSDFLSSERYVIVIKKVASSAAKYPRNYSAIVKKPL